MKTAVLPPSLIGLCLALSPRVASADDLGAIGQGAAVLFILAAGVLVVVACIVLAIMLGRWLKKPSRTSGFVLVGVSWVLSAAWFLLLIAALQPPFVGPDDFTNPGILAWLILGGGALSIAPVIVVIRSIKLLRLLLKTPGTTGTG